MQEPKPILKNERDKRRGFRPTEEAPHSSHVPRDAEVISEGIREASWVNPHKGEPPTKPYVSAEEIKRIKKAHS